MGKLFTIRSLWDLFALPALVQWMLLPVGLLALVAALDTALVLVVLALYALNLLTVLTPLATYFGSKRHKHLNPGTLYHVAGFFFGPIVGLHYLLKTRDTIRNERSDSDEASVT